MDFGELRNSGGTRDPKQQQKVEGGGLDGGKPQQFNKVNLTFSITYDAKDGLEAKLNWTHPPGGRKKSQSSHDVPHGGVGGETAGMMDYEVLYILHECGVYPDLPKCLYPQDLYSSEVPVPRNQVVSVVVVVVVIVLVTLELMVIRIVVAS